jgi:hypothetical protein
MSDPRTHQRKIPAPAPVSDHDLLWGAEAIGHAIGLPLRKTFWLLENQKLPARKIGNKWVASRARLIAFCTAGGGGG